MLLLESCSFRLLIENPTKTCSKQLKDIENVLPNYQLSWVRSTNKIKIKKKNKEEKKTRVVFVNGIAINGELKMFESGIGSKR